MDAKTGKEVWQVKSPEPATIQNGYAMTGAPLIANGVVIVGVAGAEFSIAASSKDTTRRPASISGASTPCRRRREGFRNVGAATPRLRAAAAAG